MKPEIEILKEIITVIENVYGNSGYMQLIVYAANENKVDNWYRRAKKIISDYEKQIA